jgi:hypothetical protein
MNCSSNALLGDAYDYKKGNYIMAEKNISLLVRRSLSIVGFGLLMALSADQTLSSDSVPGISLVNSKYTNYISNEISPQSSSLNSVRTSDGSNTSSASAGSMTSTLSEAKITQQAQQFINKTFKKIDDWIASDEDVKIAEAVKYMHIALDVVGKKIGEVTMQPIKNVVDHAITFFSTETVATKEGYINNKILARIVNGVKIMMIAPVKISIRKTLGGIGKSAGLAGGSITGFVEGVRETAKTIAEIRIIDKTTGEISTTKIALLLPKVIAITLVGVVGTATLIAYRSYEGSFIGGKVGDKIGTRLTGEQTFSFKYKPAILQIDNVEIDEGQSPNKSDGVVTKQLSIELVKAQQQKANDEIANIRVQREAQLPKQQHTEKYYSQERMM